jgi:hypothetical protein
VTEDDTRLATALRAALKERDRVVRPPRFAALWPDRSERRGTQFAWRALATSAACALVVAGIVWKLAERPGRIDAALAQQLSSDDYWRVPTDELLVYEAAPLRAELPSPTGLQISLEESLL